MKNRNNRLTKNNPGSPRDKFCHLITKAISSAFLMILLTACSNDNNGSQSTPELTVTDTPLVCDDTMIDAFQPDANTTIILVKAFSQGDSLALADTPANPPPPVASMDLCLVKMIVGPGNPGTVGAPSTSVGIGIEVWLPTNAEWNQRIRNVGGGGWAGGNHTSATLIGNVRAAQAVASGYATGSTDTGHANSFSGAFAMLEDGGINTELWNDFSDRSLKELAIKTKALVEAFYGSEETFAYWDGCSTGGRQGYKMAQEHPEYYDGYLNVAPAFNWTQFITNELYPQVVMQQDLGGPMSSAKLDFVSGAAVSACDVVNGEHLGFVVDTAQCRYDPMRDATVLCAGEQGNGVIGTSANVACVSSLEATAVNKIWYGQTSDGNAPDPLTDNAGNPILTASNHLWWGLKRGTNLAFLASSYTPFSIAANMVALELQNSSYATPAFINATGDGTNRWNELSYTDLAYAYDQGLALQSFFGNINTNNPDLTGVRDHGAKILSLHGLADQLITPDGSINYYSRASSVVGGNTELQKFNRLYLAPGMGHCAGIGTVNGNESPAATANSVPLPAPDQLFEILVQWVEGNTTPESIILSSADMSVTMPVCPYPQKATHDGIGAVTDAASYTCQ
ncbi:MAG: tannase/feruloyl esterase family alpha/beta hydrolase [Spongiibacteraceae bacterium]|nr:tannase/feruloyl esterase family alpha/beta hydrolase [Spongiibacteraceae bacterium]